MTYRITYKTNYHSEYFVLAENLSTKNSYEYSLHSKRFSHHNCMERGFSLRAFAKDGLLSCPTTKKLDILK